MDSSDIPNQRGATDTRPTPSKKIENSTYHAVLIAGNEYNNPNITRLKRPIEDARAVKRVLSRDYSFRSDNVKVVENPTREELFEAFEYAGNIADKQSNLLIFFAGHGHYDELREEGFG